MKKAKFFELRCNRCGETQYILITQDLEIIKVRNGLEVFLPSSNTTFTLEQGLRCASNETPTPTDSSTVPWAPWFALDDACAMAVYGVRLPKEALEKGLTSELYSNLYLYKLVHLLEQWDGEPIPVLLDRYFTAPYLGAGEPQQVLLDMWQNLDEIRKPVGDVMKLIESGKPISLLETSKARELDRVLSSLKLDYFLECLSKIAQGT